MELWKEVFNDVYLEDVPDVSTASATWTKNGVAQGSIATSEVSGSVWKATLPYIQDECDVTVTWSFTLAAGGAYTKTDYYEIVTPLLNMREIKAVWPEATDTEAKNVESAVRHIIQANTGQTFGKRTKTLSVRGAGDMALALPERLMSITGIATLYSTLDVNAVIIIADGWYLKKSWSETTAIEPPPTETYFGPFDGDEPGPWEDGTIRLSDGSYVGTLKPRGPVISFGSSATVWADDYPFNITGTWGYQAVPQPVREAAKLLINDYACSEQQYRDRYLESVKSADWRLQFTSGAYARTGNVRADQLLYDYVVERGWAVI